MQITFFRYLLTFFAITDAVYSDSHTGCLGLIAQAANQAARPSSRAGASPAPEAPAVMVVGSRPTYGASLGGARVDSTEGIGWASSRDKAELRPPAASDGPFGNPYGSPYAHATAERGSCRARGPIPVAPLRPHPRAACIAATRATPPRRRRPKSRRRRRRGSNSSHRSRRRRLRVGCRRAPWPFPGCSGVEEHRGRTSVDLSARLPGFERPSQKRATRTGIKDELQRR